MRGLTLNSVLLATVTHQHQFLGESRCLLMSQGKISVDGSFNDCIAAANGRLDSVLFHNDGDTTDESKKLELSDSNTKKEEEKKEATTDDNKLPNIDDDDAKKPAKDNQEETKFEGLVSRATFMHYAKSMGGWGIALWAIILFAASQAASLACIAIIGRWSERSLEKQVSNF